MSKEILNCQNDLAYRDKEKSDAVYSKTELFKFLVKLVLRKPELSSHIMNLMISCNHRDLNNWKWIFKNYFFSWNSKILNFNWEEFKNCSSIELFNSNIFLDSLISNWVDFNSDDLARNKLHNFISSLISNIEISYFSRKNLNEAVQKAKSENKKLVILSNHMSHLDAPVLDYILNLHIWEDFDRIRFLTGSFMYYNKHVRPFVKCFDTTFVFWPMDFWEVTKKFFREYKEDFHLLRKFQNSVIDSVKNNHSSETIVIFPYAWRAQNIEDFWCKESIPVWMTEMLTQDNCLYLPICFSWSSDIFDWNESWWGWDMLNNFLSIKKTKIKVVVWIPYSNNAWLDLLNEQMKSCSREAFDK